MKQYLPYVSIAIGLTGVSLALYFHHQAVKERQPLYYVGQRAVIVDASVSTPSPITVLYKGKPVGETQSVIAATVYFWNGGKQPIRLEDVLEPLSIQLDPSAEILESRLIRASRPVIRFEKLDVGARFVKHDVVEIVTPEVPISFTILEHNDGAAIQVIYAGKIDVPIVVKGTIVEAGSPKLFSVANATPEHSHGTHSWFYIFGNATFLALLLSVSVWVDVKRGHTLKHALVGHGIMVIPILFIVGYDVFRDLLATPIPPSILQ
jgi:hypothetical protein